MATEPLQGRPQGIYWYVLQTHAAAEIAFNRYVRSTTGAEGFLIDKNESEKKVRISNESEIFFKSGQNYEDLRAETLDGLIIDEYRQQDPRLWPVVRPMLAARHAWCDVLTTSNGFDHSYDLYNQALANPAEWGVVHAPSTEAWWWTPAEIASARASMSDDEFAQEIMAEFREMGVGKAYKNHSQANQIIQNPFSENHEWSPFLPIIVGLDFNVGLMCWELGQMKGPNFYYGDEIAVRNTDSEECATILANKVKNHRPGLILVGDSSGHARKTSAVGQTDYKIIHRVLSEFNIKYEDRTPDANPHVKDRVNCMNGKLKSADGSIHLWYNPIKCPYLKKNMERDKWKEKADGAVLDKSDPDATHASDAAGYPIAYFSELLKQTVGTLKVVNR